MDSRHWKLIQDLGYHLVLDEELAVVERFDDAKRGDLRVMVDSGLAEVSEPLFRVKVTRPVEFYRNSSHQNIAEAAQEGYLFTAKNTSQYNFMVTMVPVELFKSFRSVLILTYMFEGSVLDLYLQLHSLKWEYVDLPLHKTSKEVVGQLRSLITFKTIRSLEGLSRFTLSHTWYAGARQEQLLRVGAAVASVRRQEGPERLLLTLPKEYALRGRKSVCRTKDAPAMAQWLWAGMRATNEHAHKDVVLHLYNRFPNENVRVYFEQHGLKLDKDRFALAEMIQFVFRSAVRNGKAISLYVGSTRMRRLFEQWLDQTDSRELMAA
ncbi:hypothetical protein [Paracoccus benzoatiresistens]|uniref:Uncharacterized protein n=1 Tax=Paracoccus benzoatiresistens TaxID=2997341 RepID=A0ABT4JB59_9RHOB|nr:hypothetical protein [Paracoccus sp. EF6]MCZ0964319.1 hypothetical protein [Paracoccus sp. EF6]